MSDLNYKNFVSDTNLLKAAVGSLMGTHGRFKAVGPASLLLLLSSP
jgi:hypothetical protein